jgi:3-phosphoshikimate 1-carboxyvinyltransferase
MNDTERVDHPRQLRGSIRVPGDKSTSHRALMLSALASGQSTVRGLSPGDDVAATRVILEQLGARITEEDGVVRVIGPDSGLNASAEVLECENSGTTMRLLCGLVSAIPGTHQLAGDASLSKRPMDRVATPLALMGATVTGVGERVTPPLRVASPPTLHSIEYLVPVPSAQVKSAILLAGLAADGPSIITEIVRTRTTTEDMLRAAGITVATTATGEGRTITLAPGRPRQYDWFVPGDPSQAAYFAVLGAIHADATLEVLSIDAAPERVGFVSVLARMGADVSIVERGGVFVLHTRSSTLHATEVLAAEIPSVDEVPVLTVAACAASGVSAFRSMGELRLKESDRFAGSLALARALGARAWSDGDDFFIEGLGEASRFEEFSFAAVLDHRMIMASAVAGCAGHGCTIDGATSVASSYPHFFRDLALLG